MTTPKHDKTPAKARAKPAEPNNDSARTNEILAARVAASDVDPVKESLKLNNPSLSSSAYTSHESGFVDDLQGDETPPDGGAKVQTQSKAVNK